MTKTNLDIWDNENSVQHLLEMYDNILSVRSRAKGGSKNPWLIKIDSVTSGHCWIPTFWGEENCQGKPLLQNDRNSCLWKEGEKIGLLMSDLFGSWLCS